MKDCKVLLATTMSIGANIVETMCIGVDGGNASDLVVARL